MSDPTTTPPTEADLARDLRADLAFWESDDFADDPRHDGIRAALRRAIDAEAERDNLRRLLAKVAEVDALKRLEAWSAGEGNEPVIERDGGGWVAYLMGFGGPAGRQAVEAFGFAAGQRRARPYQVYLHDGATLAECILAALDLWTSLYEGGT